MSYPPQGTVSIDANVDIKPSERLPGEPAMPPVEPRTRTDPDLCRCPEGWPTPIATFKDGQPLVVVRHHLGDCGLPEEIDSDETEES